MSARASGEPAAAPGASAPTLVPPVGPDDHRAGPDDALVTLVEYGDFECPDCAMAFPIVRALQRRLGARLRFVFRPFPLREAHPHAQRAAEAAEAAGAQGHFWAMHDRLFEAPHALEDADLLRHAARLRLDVERVRAELEAGTHAARVRASFRGGVRSGVNRTPTFFIDGRRHDGAWADEGAFHGVLRTAAKVAEARAAEATIAEASGAEARGSRARAGKDTFRA